MDIRRTSMRHWMAATLPAGYRWMIAAVLMLAGAGCQTCFDRIPLERRYIPESCNDDWDPVLGTCHQCGTCGGGNCPGFTPAMYAKHMKTCVAGCGEVYWNEWINDPPDECDPCDNWGDWIGARCCPPRPRDIFRDGLLGQRFCGHCGTAGCTGGCAASEAVEHVSTSETMSASPSYLPSVHPSGQSPARARSSQPTPANRAKVNPDTQAEMPESPMADEPKSDSAQSESSRESAEQPDGIERSSRKDVYDSEQSVQSGPNRQYRNSNSSKATVVSHRSRQGYSRRQQPASRTTKTGG